MNENRDHRSEDPRDEKQPYARPELVKHGKVESLTQFPPNGSTSQPPIIIDDV